MTDLNRPGKTAFPIAPVRFFVPLSCGGRFWEAGILPLNYARTCAQPIVNKQITHRAAGRMEVQRPLKRTAFDLPAAMIPRFWPLGRPRRTQNAGLASWNAKKANQIAIACGKELAVTHNHRFLSPFLTEGCTVVSTSRSPLRVCEWTECGGGAADTLCAVCGARKARVGRKQSPPPWRVSIRRRASNGQRAAGGTSCRRRPAEPFLRVRRWSRFRTTFPRKHCRHRSR